MKKNILLPTDFSDNAWYAIAYALKFYAHVECNFYFLHSVKMNVSTMSTFSNKLLSTMSDKAKEDLKELKDKARNFNLNAKHEFEIIISSSNLYDAINASVEKYNVDLTVMGTKGATGTKEFFFGSNTVSAIDKIKQCPILIVPDAFEFIEPKQIAFPADFNRFYGEELQPIRTISDLYNSHISIVHVNDKDNLTDSQNSNLSILKSYLKNDTYSIHWKPDYTKKTSAIQDFINEFDINLLVMINYKHSFIESVVKEPVVKKIGFQPTIPFLVIPGPV